MTTPTAPTVPTVATVATYRVSARNSSQEPSETGKTYKRILAGFNSGMVGEVLPSPHTWLLETKLLLSDGRIVYVLPQYLEPIAQKPAQKPVGGKRGKQAVARPEPAQPEPVKDSPPICPVCIRCGFSPDPSDPATNFYTRTNGKPISYCRPCSNEKSSLYRKAHQEDCNQVKHAYQLRSPAKHREAAKKYRESRKDIINARARDDYAVSSALADGRKSFACGFLLLKRAPEGERVTYRPYPSDKPFAHLKHTRAIAEVLPVVEEGDREGRRDRIHWVALARPHITDDESATVRRLVLRLRRERERGGR